MEDNTNYLLLLMEDYPDFKNNSFKFSAEDQRDPSLQKYAQILWSALKRHRKGLANKPDLQRLIPKEQKKEKAKFLKGLDDEAKAAIIPCNGIVEKAAIFQEGLRNAGRIRQAEDSVELGLQAETRARLRAMTVADRMLAVQNSRMNYIAFRSVENDPLLDQNFLGKGEETKKTLDNVRAAYVQANFPKVLKDARITSHKAEIAGMMRDFALGGLKQNEVNAGI